MSLIITLIMGGIVGWIASMIMKTNAQMGWIANVLVGLVGALLGFWVAGMLGVAATGIMRFVVALVGAVLLLWILRALGVFGKERTRVP